MDEAEGRARITSLAQSYLRTPYLHRGRIRGVGVDCATLPALVYEQAGLIDKVVLGNYSPQFNLNSSDETYLAAIEAHMGEVTAPRPGDLVLWKMGRRYGHSAIVIAWPRVIHARTGSGVEWCDAERDQALATDNSKPRDRKFFSLWVKR